MDGASDGNSDGGLEIDGALEPEGALEGAREGTVDGLSESKISLARTSM
jgi:hypothetical protein